MNDEIRALVVEIEASDAQETDDLAATLEWIDSGADLYRTAKPATPPVHLVAYSVLTDPDREAVFLVDHRDAGLWLPPGGHIEPGEPAAGAATREILEELSICPQFHPAAGPKPVMLTITQTVGRSVPHTDISLWFAFSGSESEPMQPDPGEFRETRWWRLDEVRHGPDTRFEPNLPRFIGKFFAMG